MISTMLYIVGVLEIVTGLILFFKWPDPLNTYALMTGFISCVFIFAFASVIDLLTEIRDVLVGGKGIKKKETIEENDDYLEELPRP